MTIEEIKKAGEELDAAMTKRGYALTSERRRDGKPYFRTYTHRELRWSYNYMIDENRKTFEPCF